MTASDRRRPVTARDFNRLIFALLLLAALTVFARLITRQESRAEGQLPDHITLAQWQQTADALFLKGEWQMAADAYYGALEAAALRGVELQPRLFKKLSACLEHGAEPRAALHYLRLYRARLLTYQKKPLLNDLPPDDPLRNPDVLARELEEVVRKLETWKASGA